MIFATLSSPGPPEESKTPILGSQKGVSKSARIIVSLFGHRSFFFFLDRVFHGRYPLSRGTCAPRFSVECAFFFDSSGGPGDAKLAHHFVNPRYSVSLKKLIPRHMGDFVSWEKTSYLWQINSRSAVSPNAWIARKTDSSAHGRFCVVGKSIVFVTNSFA